MTGKTFKAGDVQQIVLSVLDAAGLLGVGETTIREAVRNKQIPHTRFGRRILFRRVDLEKMMEPAAQ